MVNFVSCLTVIVNWSNENIKLLPKSKANIIINEWMEKKYFVTGFYMHFNWAAITIE